jgi:hypothetical protein
MQDLGGSARLENNLDFPMASLLFADLDVGRGADAACRRKEP